MSLADLLGIKPVSDSDFETTYIGEISTELRDGIWDEPVRCDGNARLIEPTTAEILARFIPPVAKYSHERWIWRQPNPPQRNAPAGPAITVNHVGKGNAVFISCALGAPFTPMPAQQRLMGRLCANIVRWLDPDPILRSSGIPSGVEVTISQKGSSHVVHLLNHHVVGGSFQCDDAIPTLADIEIHVNERRVGRVINARNLRTDHEISMNRTDSWVRLLLDRLDVHEMILLER